MIPLRQLDELKKIDLSELEAVLWDMDGTLVNTEFLHLESTLLSLKESSTYTLEQLEVDINGYADEQVFDAINEHIRAKTLTSFIDEKTKHLERLLMQKKDQIIKPEVIDFILKAKKSGLKVVLVTSAHRSIMKKTLKPFKTVIPLFDLTTCYEDTTQHKPHPAPYQLALTKLELDKSKVIVFEDSDVGLESASRAGVKQVYKIEWYNK